MSTTLDTLAVAKTLQKATFPAEQAEALARVLREREEANPSAVATKQDLALLATKTDLAEVKA